MAPLPSLETAGSLDSAQRAVLLDIARSSIRHGFAHGSPIPVDPGGLPPELAEQRASFVTLHSLGQLRGCIGSVRPCRPLAEDIAGNAFSAAFEDWRFPPVTSQELRFLSIDVSILLPPEPIAFTSEADLLAQLQPGLDGLLIQGQWHQGLFLPAVWESLPDPADFLRQLKLKAGLGRQPATSLKAFRFRTESFGEG